MLHVWYAIGFRFNSDLGDFPFVCFFFKTFHIVYLGVRFKVSVSVTV